MRKDIPLIKKTLDKLYNEVDYDAFVRNDPIEFPHRYSDTRDKEVVAFVSCCFAHGKVSLFKKALGEIFDYLGNSPYLFLVDSNEDSFNKLNTYYRQSSINDVRAFLYATGHILREHKSLERLFFKYYNSKDPDYTSALNGFVHEFYKIDLMGFYSDGKISRGFIQLLPDPSKGSTCKRLHLFLRWMIRKEKPDLGLWDYPTDKLLIPVDTHIAKLSGYIGLSKRKTLDIEFSKEVSFELRKLNKEDPVRYDFSLCHIGISKGCTPKKGASPCTSCSVAPICQNYSDRL